MSGMIFGTRPQIDIYGDFRNMESLSADLKLLFDLLRGSANVNRVGIKPRYIIEVTRDNIDYCKGLMKILDLRHLNNLRGNFVLYENKYTFLYEDNVSNNNNVDDREENKEEKNTSPLIGNEFRTKVVKQIQRYYDTLWDNSTPADVKVNEIVNNEKDISHTKEIIPQNNFCNYVFDPQNNTSDSDSKNSVMVIRNLQDIEYLLLSNVYNARSEVLLALHSLEYFKNLWKIGLEESLKHSISQGARIIILYPELRNNEIIVNDVLSLISSIKDNIQLESIAGTMGSVLIVDNYKLLLLDTVKDRGEREKNEIANKGGNIDIIGVYSNIKSIVNNYGALFDTLLNEKKTVSFASKVKEQLERSNKQLVESNQHLKTNSELQQEFINIAAHELRTPTQAIIGYIEMIDESPKNIDNTQKYLKPILRNATRLERLVEDLLDIARIESNTMTLDKEKTNLEQLINMVVQDFKANLEKEKKVANDKIDNNNENGTQKKNIEIITSINSKIDNNDTQTEFDVMVDRSKIIQVISNIINNSLTSIRSNKKNNDTNCDSVHITLSKFINNKGHEKPNTRDSSNRNKKNEILVGIRDTGKGIDAEILPRLFTKFATNSTSGTGLGLYLTKAIIEAHGGKVWAENNNNGHGAIFYFTLPLA